MAAEEAAVILAAAAVEAEDAQVQDHAHKERYVAMEPVINRQRARQVAKAQEPLIAQEQAQEQAKAMADVNTIN